MGVVEFAEEGRKKRNIEVRGVKGDAKALGLA